MFSESYDGSATRLRAVPVTTLTFSSMVRVGLLLGAASTFMASVLAWGAALGAPDAVPFGDPGTPAFFKALFAFLFVAIVGTVISAAVTVVGATLFSIGGQQLPLGNLYFYEQGPLAHPAPISQPPEQPRHQHHAHLHGGPVSKPKANVLVDDI